MNWARFERFALDGSDSEWINMLFWPCFLAAMAFLIAAPIREWLYRHNFMPKEKSPQQ